RRSPRSPRCRPGWWSPRPRTSRSCTVPCSPRWTPRGTRSSAPRSIEVPPTAAAYTRGARGTIQLVRLDPDLVIVAEKATVMRGGRDLLRDIDWQVELDERW